jgi:hypothetical protein
MTSAPLFGSVFFNEPEAPAKGRLASRVGDPLWAIDAPHLPDASLGHSDWDILPAASLSRKAVMRIPQSPLRTEVAGRERPQRWMPTGPTAAASRTPRRQIAKTTVQTSLIPCPHLGGLGAKIMASHIADAFPTFSNNSATISSNPELFNVIISLLDNIPQTGEWLPEF